MNNWQIKNILQDCLIRNVRGHMKENKRKITRYDLRYKVKITKSF